MDMEQAIQAAIQGDAKGYERLVQLTQHAAYAVVRQVVSDHAEAHDVTQEAYLRAFKRLHMLRDSQSFPAWLRRIAVSTALNHIRDHRKFFVQSERALEVPVLDEDETTWSPEQRAALARVISHLGRDERLLCDRFYHGGWSVSRLAAAAGITENAQKKRLQRLRDKMRREIEMSEQDAISRDDVPKELPSRVAELLARPRLTSLPENPVGSVFAQVQAYLADYEMLELPERLDSTHLATCFPEIGGALVTSGAEAAFQAGDQWLRTDLTLPMLLAAERQTGKRSLLAAGKVYRELDAESPSHLRAFHQLELFHVDAVMNEWNWIGEIVGLMRHLLPNCQYRIEPTEFAPCDETWSLEICHQGNWSEVLGCGRYRREVVTALHHDPAEVSIFGAGLGLERLAMLVYDLQDIRQVAGANVN